jgi:hypothetical protein
MEMANHAAALQEELDLKFEKESIIKLAKEQDKAREKEREEEELRKLVSQSESQFNIEDEEDGGGDGGGDGVEKGEQVKEPVQPDSGDQQMKNDNIGDEKETEKISQANEGGEDTSLTAVEVVVDPDNDNGGDDIEENKDNDAMVPYIRSGGSVSSALFQSIDDDDNNDNINNNGDTEEAVIEEVGKDDINSLTSFDLNSKDKEDSIGSPTSKEEDQEEEEEEEEEDSFDKRQEEAAKTKARYEKLVQDKLSKRPKNPLRHFQLKCMTILAKLNQDQNMLTAAEEMYRKCILEGVSVGSRESRYSLLESVGEFSVDGESDEEGGDEDDRIAEMAQQEKEMIEKYQKAK